jgi:hypothetical protein
MKDDINLYDAMVRTDLYSFVRAAFPIVSPGVPFLPNWHIESMTTHLMQVLAGDITASAPIAYQRAS